jgi:hypothetical protein
MLLSTPNQSSTAAVRLPSPAVHAAPAVVRPSSAEGRRPAALIRVIDAAIVGFMLLAVVSLLTMSGGMLTNWKIHYLTSGGNFYEKLHPATYFTVLAFGLMIIRNGDPVGDIVRMFAGAAC